MSGRGTSGGVVFQSEVGACLAALMLAERPISSVGSGLPGTPRKLFFETPTAVDDILVETDCGHIYIQAKRTINLSKSADGELASVAQQFVRQFRAGAIFEGQQRDLNVLKDRLILAVGDETSDTVAIHLKQVLERNRTGAATAMPASLMSALSTFSDLIDAAWLDETGVKITDTSREAILSLSAVINIGESQRQLATEIFHQVVANSGDETALFNQLEKWAADASQSGVGGNRDSIRQSLLGIISLKEPPSFERDVNRLLVYSRDTVRRLKRFTELSTPDGDITLTRPVVDLVVEAARKGSLVITGEPGAGKSSVICQVAEMLSKEAKVITLTVEADAISLNNLRQTIQLKHPLTEVLQQMSGHQPAYLLIDALDAVRGGQAEQTYRKLVQEVAALPDWTIIASIRTFDLRLGKELRALFKGAAPWTDYADKSFPYVRHVHIGLLSNLESDDLALKSPRLHAAIEASGSKIISLAKNLFNLGLVAELLASGVTADALALVKTRGQLLERYWQERITDLGTPAIIALKQVVSLMVTARAIDLSETEIPMETASTVDRLQQVGVLIFESTRRIGFRHHVLFDYAVARLMLLPNQELAIRLINKANSVGLLISPSLGYWLEEFKERSSATNFWSLITSICGDDTIDPIIRVECARIAVETVSETDSLLPLADIIKKNLPHQRVAFGQLVGSLTTKDIDKQPIITAPWAELVGALDNPALEQLGTIHVLIGILLNYPNDPQALTSLGIASRNLFESMSANEWLIPRLAHFAIKYVAQTYITDPASSRILLEKIFLKDRFKKFGHIEVPTLTEEVLSIAGSDADLIALLYHRVFMGNNFSHDDVTPMSNSYILPITSNTAQDFSMAEHYLSHAFATLIEQFPKTGIRAFAATVHGERGKHHLPDEEQVQMLPLESINRPFTEDHCYTWAWNIETEQYGEFPKIYQSFLKWAIAIDDPAVLNDIPDLVLQETGSSLAWKALFYIAKEKPETLGMKLWPSATHPVILYSNDTRQIAIDFIGNVYPYLQKAERVEAEKAWLQLDFPDFQEPKLARLRILGILFECIGEPQLATQEARLLLSEVKEADIKLENRKPFSIEHNNGLTWPDPEESITDDYDTSQLINLKKSIKAAKDIIARDKLEEDNTRLWNALFTLDQAIIANEDVVNSPLEADASDTLAAGLGIVLRLNYVPKEDQEKAVARLLELTYHQKPYTTSESEREFASTSIWNSLSPRIEAAGAIAQLITNTDLWPFIKERIKSLLLDDPHPAVRFQVACYISQVRIIDNDFFWELVENFLTKETNSSVLRYSLKSLEGIARCNDSRFEPFILALLNRLPSPQSGVSDITNLIIYYAINSDQSASQEIVNTWITNYNSEEERLYTALFTIRDNLVLGFNELAPVEEAIRDRSINFIESLIKVIEPEVRSWPLDGSEPTLEQKAAMSLFEAIADQFYYAVGYDDKIAALKIDSARCQFLQLYSPFISKLTTLGTPGAIHRILKILIKFTDVEPEICFDLISEALLRTTGIAKYEYEPMGATQFVEIVGQYLADYRYIFDEDNRREKLINCLALFVNVGWPAARKLFQNLPELLQ